MTVPDREITFEGMKVNVHCPHCDAKNYVGLSIMRAEMHCTECKGYFIAIRRSEALPSSSLRHR